MDNRSEVLSMINLPEVKGLTPLNEGERYVAGLLNGLLQATETDRLIERQRKARKETNAVLYRDVFNPRYEREEVTEQGERNRQILLWAIDHNIAVPKKLTTKDTYTNTPTAELLEQVLTTEQVTKLHGDLVFQVAGAIKDVEPGSSITFGGLVYTQSRIDREEDGPILRLLQREFLATAGFNEPGIMPGILRRNVKGSIHVIPYGEARKIPGREKETLLMIANDFVALLDYLKSSSEMGFPRFVKNGTNRDMAAVAQRYVGAQVQEMNEIDYFVNALSGALLSGGPPQSEDAVKVFVSEEALKRGSTKLADLRDKLVTKLTANSEGLDASSLMKKIRIDAIQSVASRLRFKDTYTGGMQRVLVSA